MRPGIMFRVEFPVHTAHIAGIADSSRDFQAPARRVIPGGVNSPVRGNRGNSTGPEPSGVDAWGFLPAAARAKLWRGRESDSDRFAAFHGIMLEQGVHLAPSQFETLFLSAAHTEVDVDQIVAAARKAFARL